MAGPILPEIGLPEFAREFPLRAPRLGLLIGAGASVSSGVPSAADLIWEFKRQIFATETSRHPASVGMQIIPEVQESLDRFFAAKAGSPMPGSPDEYAYYFEKAYPDAEVRRRFIDKRLEAAQPAYGYYCLGSLMKHGKVRLIWTTNFEDLPERAYSIVAEGKAAGVVGLDTSKRLSLLLRDERYPIIVKLHGDFRYERLRNTVAEVAQCDAELRQHLLEVSRGNGLVVVGYSGRDSSVMDALRAVLRLHGSNSFPEGLYWCVRESDACPTRVEELLAEASRHGVRAAVIRIPDFDDFAASLYRASELVDDRVDSRIAQSRPGRAGYEMLRTGVADPVLKFGAIPVSSYPDTCYKFKASVATWPELRAITKDRQIAGALHGGFVHALGTRAAIQDAFNGHDLKDLQVAPITEDDLRVPDSKTLGMFYEALAGAFANHASSLLSVTGRRTRLLFVKQTAPIPEQLTSEFAKLTLKNARQIVRRIESGHFWIHEAVEIAIEFRERVMWLLFRPTVFLTQNGHEPWTDPSKKEVIRELLAERYNRQYSGLLNFWLKLLFQCSDEGVLRFPTVPDGGFRFSLNKKLAFSHHRS